MFNIEENLKKLPDKPGVYIHKDKLGQVIYVGKAISLKNRVRQYFQKSALKNPKTRALVSNIQEFEWITCSTEMEALILECNLIKKHMPKYNILLRDDKTYPYIVVTTEEEYPRILKTRTIKRDKNKYFGPYTDVGAVNRIVEILNDIFVLKRCSAKDFPERFRPCLNYHIGTCRGICLGNVDKKAYRHDIDQALDYLKGRDKDFIKIIEEKMIVASDQMKFEEAARYRDILKDIEVLGQTQRVSMTKEKDLDIVLGGRNSHNNFVVLFNVRDGKLTGREIFPIEIQQSRKDETLLKEVVAEFIKQYYSQWAKVPPEILVEDDIADRALIEEFLSSFGHKVKIYKPERGPKKNLLVLTQRDRNEMLKTIEDRIQSAKEKSKALSKEIYKVICTTKSNNRISEVLEYNHKDFPLEKEEFRVEAYDISNTNGVDTVGAMVVFQGLKPVRKAYRRFKIRTAEASDDYGSLQEVIYRRMKRYRDGDKSFETLPDIIFMDGGQGQVNAALTVLKAMKIDIPVIGLAKDQSHRTRAIVFSNGNEIPLDKLPLLFKYCGTIQEEVHRFAIDYHRKLRGKKIGSILDNIKGVGPIKRNALLAHFKSIDEIKGASIEELMKVEGITENIAQEIKKYFG